MCDDDEVNCFQSLSLSRGHCTSMGFMCGGSDDDDDDDDSDDVMTVFMVQTLGRG